MNRWLQKKQNTIETNPTEESNDDIPSGSNVTHELLPKKKKYEIPFQPKWKEQFPWLEEDGLNNTKRCMYCKTSVSGGKAHLDRHASNATHQKAYLAAKTSMKIDLFAEKKSQNKFQKSKKLEVALSLFVAEHNLPFSVLDHLSHLIKKNIDDSAVVKNFLLNRQKGQKIIKNLTGPENSKIISTIVNQQYFSLVVDESTDSTVCKNLAFVIRVFNFKCEDMFVCLRQIEDGSADGIFNTICDVFKEKQIPFKHMVGFTADNCAVMMGRLNGVQAKLKQVVPNLIVNGCICHNLSLSAKAASIDIPSSIDGLIRKICYHFCNSASRRLDFKKFQEHFGTQLHVLISCNATRWLSRQAAIDRILEQWEPLKYYFQLADFETYSSKEAINFISTNLNNSTKLYFFFLSYVLGLTNNLNLEMQAEDARIHVILPRVKTLFKQICRNFIDHNVINTQNVFNLNLNEHHTPLDNVYCGDLVESFCLEKLIDTQEILKFKQDVKNYYIRFLEDLRKRIDINDAFLNSLDLFTPEAVVSGKYNSILKFIFEFFPNEKKNIQLINNEYKQIVDYEKFKNMKNYSISNFWYEVSLVKNECNQYMFKNIFRIAQAILSVPHSSANVERIFSYQNLIKTKCRNKLQVSTVSALIETKNLIKNSCCYDYNIKENILNTYTYNKRRFKHR